METPAWAVNKTKFLQAQKFIKDQGVEVSEEAVKARYVALGGLLAEDAPSVPKKTKAK